MHGRVGNEMFLIALVRDGITEDHGSMEKKQGQMVVTVFNKDQSEDAADEDINTDCKSR